MIVGLGERDRNEVARDFATLDDGARISSPPSGRSARSTCANLPPTRTAICLGDLGRGDAQRRLRRDHPGLRAGGDGPARAGLGQRAGARRDRLQGRSARAGRHRGNDRGRALRPARRLPELRRQMPRSTVCARPHRGRAERRRGLRLRSVLRVSFRHPAPRPTRPATLPEGLVMNASRLASVAIVIGAVAWVASGQEVISGDHRRGAEVRDRGGGAPPPPPTAGAHCGGAGSLLRRRGARRRRRPRAQHHAVGGSLAPTGAPARSPARRG